MIAIAAMSACLTVIGCSIPTGTLSILHAIRWKRYARSMSSIPSKKDLSDLNRSPQGLGLSPR
jgi:hypothetical protein